METINCQTAKAGDTFYFIEADVCGEILKLTVSSKNDNILRFRETSLLRWNAGKSCMETLYVTEQGKPAWKEIIGELSDTNPISSADKLAHIRTIIDNADEFLLDMICDLIKASKYDDNKRSY